VGGCALTLECGQHDDPAAPEVAYRAIVNTLAHLKLIDAPDPAPAARMEGLRLCEVVPRLHAGDALLGDWTSFDPVSAGEPIARRHDGAEVRAPHAGYVVFPNPSADVGNEWFYLARAEPRLSR
jgi:hypothetical protein